MSRSIVRFVADLSLAMLILLDPYIYMYTRTCVILVYVTNTRESVWVFSSMKRELEGIVRVGMELEALRRNLYDFRTLVKLRIS